MGPFTEFFRRFGSNDAGAITVDWITLSSAALVGGIIAIYAIYGAGVGGGSAPALNDGVAVADPDNSGRRCFRFFCRIICFG